MLYNNTLYKKSSTNSMHIFVATLLCAIYFVSLYVFPGLITYHAVLSMVNKCISVAFAFLPQRAHVFFIKPRRFINYVFNRAKRITGVQVITCMFVRARIQLSACLFMRNSHHDSLARCGPDNLHVSKS